MEVRVFNLCDLDGVKEMSQKAYGWFYDRELCGEEMALMCSEIQRVHAEDPQASFVAEKNSNIVGTCFGDFDPQDKNIGRLHYVAVDPDAQRNGVGMAMMEKTIACLKAKGARKIELGTDRPLAIPFYAKYNFKVTHWDMQMDLYEEDKSGEQKVEALMRLIEEYTLYKFTFRNWGILKDTIGKILDSGDSRDEKRERFLELAQSYGFFKPASADLPIVERAGEILDKC